MNESIQLLSSMSPKVESKHTNFRFKKGTTVLALKKHIRRSSIFHKSIKTVKNEKLNILESSTTASTESSSSVRIINETPIVISDSDLSSNSDSESISNNSKLKNISRRISKNSLSEDKREDIQNWIENLAKESGQDSVAYTELSTIYGDTENVNFQPKEQGCAVNSTFADGFLKKFDEMFKPVHPKSFTKNTYNSEALKIGLSEEADIDSSLEISELNASEKQSNKIKKIVIDESVSINRTLKTKITEGKLDYKTTTSNNASKLQRDSTPLSKKFTKLDIPELEHQETNYPLHTEMELESILDSFYGNQWREKRNLILPMSECKDRRTKYSHITQSESKPKVSLLYKNPYLDNEINKSKNLLQNLQKSRLKMNVESPMTERLKKFCDSESETEQEREVFSDPRTKLNFNESDDDSSEKDSKKFQNGNEDSDDNIDKDKENFDISDLGKSLEDRIRNKIFEIKDVPVSSVKHSTKKNTNKNKEKPKNDNRNFSSKDNIENNKFLKNSNLNKNVNNCNTKKTEQRLFIDDSNTSSDEEWDKEISKITYQTPRTGYYSFLASLSESVPILKCDMSARIFRSNFKTFKGELLTKLFKLYNENVFENAIPHDTLFEWSDRMRTTAGFCYCKKITRRTGAVERSVRIVLASKIIDSAGRLRDTLIHELCHAATWIVNCISDGHGKYWKSWAYKAMKTFPELPPIKRCHEYGIQTKYTYKCTGCGYSIGRHSKSLDIERKRCGHCYGKFEIFINKIGKKGETKTVPTPRREATGFALFVKENYGVYKDSNLKHGDVMKLLGQKFQEMKVNN